MRRGETRRHGRGFTLIEVLIVIIIVAILALVVIPRAMGAVRRSREASLRATLKQVRDAIECFEARTAAWPPSLADIVAANGNAISADTDGAGGAVDRAAYDGPYLRTSDGALPKDPFTNAADWNYRNATGEVHSTSTLVAVDGTRYSTW